MKKYKPVSLKKIKTYPLGKRKSKVSFHAFATPPLKGNSFKKDNFIASILVQTEVSG